MLKKYFIGFVGVSCILSTALSGYTLQESVIEVLNTNPVIKERLRNFRATQQDLNIAESGYYPSLDLRASVGYSQAGNLKGGKDDPLDFGDKWNHKVDENEYGNYETSLTFTQNLFEGFSTMNQVDYEESRILAAAHNYIEKANDIAFRMTTSYANVLRTHELTQTARENVQINETIYYKVKNLFDSGLTTDSEVKKIQSALSLARSNLTVQLNNARDAQCSYRRILGRMPNLNEMSRPSFDVAMPRSIEVAAMYAVENNPSLLVSRYNIKGAQSLWKQRKKDYYPKIDLELSQFYNDNSDDGTQVGKNGYDSVDDRFRARLILSYNLFRGGSDSANVQKHLSKINQEMEIKRDLKRQVIEGLDLSWNAYEMIGKQLVDLREYSKFSEETLALYEEEYDLGRRSLLDLLSSQNDVINSRSQIITAEYEELLAKYRILDAMGLLVLGVVGDTDKLRSQVNLYTDDEADEILDTLPVKLDVDSDNIADNLDLCDNSLFQNNIMPYGCKKLMRDSDMDGVIDSKDACDLTPVGAIVSGDGCAVDRDIDGVKDYKDDCPETPQDYEVDVDGCAVFVSIAANFKSGSSELPTETKDKISELATYMKEYPICDAHIVGHTSRTSKSNAEYNVALSLERADVIKQELMKNGIEESRLTAEGKGFEVPIAENTTESGRIKNRRVDIDLFTRDEEI